jgi:hypothetical protein
MPKFLFALITCLWASIAFPATHDTARSASAISKKTVVPDSRQLESQLQALNWEQFRSVIEAEPKLNASVEAFGPAGWQYVKANYRTYKWRRQIDKLDPQQKLRLDELIKASRKSPQAQSRKTPR